MRIVNLALLHVKSVPSVLPGLPGSPLAPEAPVGPISPVPEAPAVSQENMTLTLQRTALMTQSRVMERRQPAS